MNGTVTDVDRCSSENVLLVIGKNGMEFAKFKIVLASSIEDGICHDLAKRGIQNQ
ncbi:hypothetical protein HW560_21900 [Paenibacillus sp. E222]|uniref:hypothetical protein n=1 Tax=Paenibacillus sp. E222 TaxID=2748863 RepID=UPI0015C68EDF|nr:hypothetical protein [Paenibacillus sp. E222]QLG40491.1 hypothetical protein HW560_21900 [Paenibacillus sp. E222]